MTFWCFLASRARFCSWYWYLPKSMIRQTGGTAVGEISTRSSPFCRAMASACGGGMMPSCCPVSSMTRISRTRIRSLVRTRSSRRGERSKAIQSSSASVGHYRCDAHGCVRPIEAATTGPYARMPAPGTSSDAQSRRTRQRPRSEVASRSATNRHRALGHLPVADDQHVGDLLQLRLPNFIANLLLRASSSTRSPAAARSALTWVA